MRSGRGSPVMVAPVLCTLVGPQPAATSPATARPIPPTADARIERRVVLIAASSRALWPDRPPRGGAILARPPPQAPWDLGRIGEEYPYSPARRPAKDRLIVGPGVDTVNVCARSGDARERGRARVSATERRGVGVRRRDVLGRPRPRAAEPAG